MNIQQHEAEVVKAFIDGGHPKMALMAMFIKRMPRIILAGALACCFWLMPDSAPTLLNVASVAVGKY